MPNDYLCRTNVNNRNDMPKFDVDYDGIWNGEPYFGESVLELTDEEVNTLVELIKTHGGETDIESLELEEKYPRIYDAFHEAFIQPVAYDGSLQWAIDGYRYSYFDIPGDESIMDEIEAEGFFKFEYDEEDYLDEEGNLLEDDLMEDKCVAWREYFDELPREKQFEFLDRFYKDYIYDYDTQELTGDMYIPEEIVQLARQESNH